MLPDLFEDAFSYHAKCDLKLIEAFKNAEKEIPERALELLSHIANAHHIWDHRILDKPPQHGIWELHSLDALEELERENHGTSLRILREKELDGTVSYQNSKGKAFQNKIRDILFHIINHGTYHRGQIAMMMRQEGLEPLVTDYAILKREEGSS